MHVHRNNHFLIGFVKIPKNELTSNHLSLYPFGGNRNNFDFSVSDSTDEINIFANDQIRMHTFDKKTETLKKNAKGFTTIGMFIKEKSTQFVKS